MTRKEIDKFFEELFPSEKLQREPTLESWNILQQQLFDTECKHHPTHSLTDRYGHIIDDIMENYSDEYMELEFDN